MEFSVGRVAETIGTVLGIGALILLGIATGAGVWTLTVAPLSLTVPWGALSIAGFTAVVVVTGTVVVRDVWTGGYEIEGTASGPAAEAIVPAYNDAEVVHVSVESLLESAYEPLSVTVVVEPDDPETERRARQLAREHDRVDCLVNPRPGSKATAINAAVRRSDADYFAVFDADEEVSPEFVPTAMKELRGDTDVFQGRRIPRPTGPVETLAYCERVVVQTGYAFGELFGFTACQSSSTAFTREAFETVDGYDDKLTEDIDFAHKCYHADLTTTQDRRCTNTMEAPHSLRDLWGQRKRWRIGHVQVANDRMREALTGPIGPEDVASLLRATGGILGGASLVVIAVHVLLLSTKGIASAFFAPYLWTMFVIGAVWLRDAADGTVGYPAWTVFLAPLVYLGHGALTVKALLEYYLTWDGEWYQVTKTGT